MTITIKLQKKTNLFHVAQLKPIRFQRGYAWGGFLAGLLIGLGLALGIALYVAKSQVLVTNRAKVDEPHVATHAQGEVASRVAWDPNVGLIGSGKARVVTNPVSEASSEGGMASKVVELSKQTSQPQPQQPQVSTTVAVTSAYFVQVGAFSSIEDSQAQLAKLALLGLEAKTVEKNQANKTVLYRVRLGPYESKEEATQIKAWVATRGFPDAVLMQVRF